MNVGIIENRTKNAKKGLVSGFIYQVLGLLLPFVSRTIIIYVLGIEYIGLNTLYSSILNVLNITELGFGSAISFILYKPISEDDKEKVCAILKFAKTCFRIIGIVVLVLGICVTPFLDYIISSDRPSEINIYVLYFLNLIYTVTSYLLFSYKRILFSANQRYDLETNISSITLIAQYILQIIVLAVWKNFYLFTAMAIVSSVANNILCQIVTKKKYPLFIPKGKLEKNDLFILKKTVIGAFCSRIGSVIYSSVDNIIISSMFGLVILGKFNNYYMIIQSLLALFAVIHNSLRPILGNCIITETKDFNIRKLKEVNCLYLWLVLFCACCMICLYQEFITIWVGNAYTFDFIFVVLLVTYFLVGRINAIPGLFVEAAGFWWEKRWVYLISAGANLVLNFILGNFLGINGIIIASIMSSFFISYIGDIILLEKYYFKSRVIVLNFLLDTFKTVFLGSIILILMYLVSHLFSCSSIWLFCAKGLLILFVFISFFIIVSIFDKGTRHIRNYLFSLIRRK